MREGNAERGFTLIELMVVVAIIAVLAAVVVPSWLSSSTKAKRKSEVSAMFAEIGTKQAAFKTERDFFMGDATATSFIGTSTCPAATPTADYNFATTCLADAANAWSTLRINPPQTMVRCKYTITSNLAGTTFTPPTGFKNSQGVLNTVEPTIASHWYYVHAECDESGSGGTNAQYFQSSIDRKIQAINEGS